MLPDSSMMKPSWITSDFAGAAMPSEAATASPAKSRPIVFLNLPMSHSLIEEPPRWKRRQGFKQDMDQAGKPLFFKNVTFVTHPTCKESRHAAGTSPGPLARLA